MTANRPTYIEYTSPESEKSVYFDAPIMHIFSKKPAAEDTASPGDDAAGFIAPSPKRNSTIMSTTSLNNVRHTEHDDHSVTTPLPAEPAAASQPARHEDAMPANMLSKDYSTNPPTALSLSRKLSKRKKRDTSLSTDPMSDSGYDSPSPKNQPRSLRDSADMQPIPVVWAEGAETEHTQQQQEQNEDLPLRNKSALGYSDPKRSQSLRSYRTARDRDGESIRTTPSGRRTPGRRTSLNGGSFGSGAGTVGPAARPEDEETELFRSRSVSAEASLSKKQKLKISKSELKEAKQVAKIIKEEGKAEKMALDQAIRELADLQRAQKYSVKEEAKASASYGQALRVFHKEELAFYAARAKYERAQADLQAFEDAREAAREHAREATEMLQEKNREIEWLRAQKAADDREREVKLRELAGKM